MVWSGLLAGRLVLNAIQYFSVSAPAAVPVERQLLAGAFSAAVVSTRMSRITKCPFSGFDANCDVHLPSTVILSNTNVAVISLVGGLVNDAGCPTFLTSIPRTDCSAGPNGVADGTGVDDRRGLP